MKNYVIRYENFGECLFTCLAKSREDAIRHFRQNVGFYTILSVEETKHE